ncbi:hypothetical protein An02g05780 [Aspergillus niger]|uniref:Uncharacterized protein n=2 Tax=Aspergillus niger TaxID=5061 RepID=A2QD44_ASPNC|nr:hypothetical protein An02g05780 [Aspergillus niger]CAK47706.1 hypothetical protein An02g05780 [Aspergillus niger]
MSDNLKDPNRRVSIIPWDGRSTSPLRDSNDANFLSSFKHGFPLADASNWGMCILDSSVLACSFLRDRPLEECPPARSIRAERIKYGPDPGFVT